jgi:D-amino-acid dehydrogenase
MKAVIVGGGLIGITSAYMLARRGWEVSLLERREGPGLETSFANGALLTPSMPEPWNAPGSWKVLLKSLGHADSALQLRLKAVPGLCRWGMKFLQQSQRACYERNALKNLTLALDSLAVMSRVREETGVQYGSATPGTLRLFRDPARFEHALPWIERLSANGLAYRALSGAEIVALEPALASIGSELSGGIHYPQDEIGDAYKFCLAIAEIARSKGVQFHFQTEVSGLKIDGGKVSAVLSSEGRFVADHYVIAAGSFSPVLLRGLGIKIPVQPAKGYSVTFDRLSAPSLPRVSIVDDDYHAAVVPLETRLRVAGTAEFAGYDMSLREARIAGLLRLLRQVLPQLKIERAAGRAWTGLRPMSADGVPIIGRAAIENLWINTGHGHLGWTLAAGSARLLSELLTGDTPRVDPETFAPARFARS